MLAVSSSISTLQNQIDTVLVSQYSDSLLATTVALLDEDFYVAVRPEAWASNRTKYDWDEDRFHETALMVMKNMGIRTWRC